METYHYQARDNTGRIISGQQAALTKKDVVDALFAKDLTPVLIESNTAGKPLAKIMNFLPHNRVPLKERVIFSRQFATMIGSGIPIVRSLNVLKDQTSNKALRAALQDVAKEVEAGSNLSDAIERYPKIFSQVYVSMVRAGEVGGILDEVLNRLADQMEKDADLVSKVRGAMVYPGLIFIVMIAALVFILMVVVPQLKVVFDSINSDLPWNTMLLLNLSAALREQGIWIGLGSATAVFFLVRLIKHNMKVRHIVHRFELKIPVFGGVVKKINIARFSRSLGSLLGSGIPILEALKVVSNSLTNVIMQDEIRSAANEIKNGASLAKTLHSSKVFPPIVPEMIAIGEETGELSKILGKLAQFYDKEVEALVANLSSIIEPIMLIVMGSLVGFIIISVIGPLYQLSSAF